MCPQTWTLFRYLDGQWLAYSQYCHYPNYYLYQHHPSISSKQMGTIPITPDITSAAIKILLPVPGLAVSPLLQLLAQPIATRLTTLLAKWADKLWFHIRPHAHTDMLRSALLANLKIICVSNATVHPNGMGTCAWVIWASAEVWSGKGYVSGPPQDMYSGLVEAYGIYTVLSFLIQYMCHYPLLPQW